MILGKVRHLQGKIIRQMSALGFCIKEETVLNSRQRLILNKLFDGFGGKLKSSKWTKIAKFSADAALRDIKDLIVKGILVQENAGGRSTNYGLAKEWKMH